MVSTYRLVSKGEHFAILAKDQTFDEGVVVLGYSGADVPGLHEDVRSSSGGGRSPNKSGRAAQAIASSRPSFWD